MNYLKICVSPHSRMYLFHNSNAFCIGMDPPMKGIPEICVARELWSCSGFSLFRIINLYGDSTCRIHFEDAVGISYLYVSRCKCISDEHHTI